MVERTKNQRVKIERTALDLQQGEFAEALSMKQGSISDVERGKGNVSDKLIAKMEEVFGVNPDYINSGKSPQFINGKPKSYSLNKAITSTVHEMLTGYAPMNTYIIPIKAFGGFLSGYASKAYLDTLEKMSIPMVRGESYMFEDDGYSMVADDNKEESYYPGSWVVCTQLQDFNWLQKNKIYVFATIDGIIIKQFLKIFHIIYMIH
jgi:DNA-binding XRE family transcriptional regulator